MPTPSSKKPRCTFSGCTKPIAWGDLCNAHQQQLNRASGDRSQLKALRERGSGGAHVAGITQSADCRPRGARSLGEEARMKKPPSRDAFLRHLRNFVLPELRQIGAHVTADELELAIYFLEDRDRAPDQLAELEPRTVH